MWNEIRNKLDQLKSLDKQFQLSGAEYHQYHLKPVLSQTEIKQAEAQIGVLLPNELKSFYTTIGNGVAGPHYGLFSIEKLIGLNAADSYLGVEQFKKIAAANGELYAEELDDGSDYFELPENNIQGLVAIISEGCGHHTCLITNGEKVGRIVLLSNEGFVQESDNTLFSLYTRWLDTSIEAFSAVEKLLDGDWSTTQINTKIKEALNQNGGRDLAISLINVPKPAKLFGSASHKIYGDAKQDNWYEEQLRNYRRTRTTRA